MLNLLRHELLSRWGAIVGWGIGLALFGTLYISVYPQMEDQMADLADLPIYEAMAIDITTFGGYIASVVVQYVPLLLGIYAIITSTGTLAGEEDSGTLELILTTPLERWQIVSVKALAIAIVAFLILVIAGLGDVLVLSLIRGSTEVDVTNGQLFGAVLNGWPISMAFAMIGLFLSAFMPSRRTAALTLTVIFVASYFGKILVGMVESLEGLKPLSLFHYFDISVRVFTEGPRAGDVLLLLGVAAVFFVLALLSFERRNVTVGAWPWQRGRRPA